MEYDYDDIETNVTEDHLRIPFGISKEAGVSVRSSFSNMTHLSPTVDISNTMVAQVNNDCNTIGSIDELSSLGELSPMFFTPRRDNISRSIPTLPLGLRDLIFAASTDMVDSSFLSLPPHAIPLAKFHSEDRVDAEKVVSRNHEKYLRRSS